MANSGSQRTSQGLSGKTLPSRAFICLLRLWFMLVRLLSFCPAFTVHEVTVGARTFRCQRALVAGYNCRNLLTWCNSAPRYRHINYERWKRTLAPVGPGTHSHRPRGNDFPVGCHSENHVTVGCSTHLSGIFLSLCFGLVQFFRLFNLKENTKCLSFVILSQ